jgi:hypothetical protein
MMKRKASLTIALIACAKTKLSVPAEARFLYISYLFHRSVNYALSRKVDYIYILSAKHHLLSPDAFIDPYDLTLNDMDQNQIADWATRVINELGYKHNLQADKFILLAGKRYRRFLLPHLSNVEIPLQGLGIGQQIQWLKNKTADEPAARVSHTICISNH